MRRELTYATVCSGVECMSAADITASTVFIGE